MFSFHITDPLPHYPIPVRSRAHSAIGHQRPPAAGQHLICKQTAVKKLLLLDFKFIFPFVTGFPLWLARKI